MSVMFFKKNKKIVKCKQVIYVLVLVGVLLLGCICGIKVSQRGNCLQERLIEAEKSNEDRQINNENLKIYEESNDKAENKINNILEKESDLNAILAKIHKEYIYSQWFLENRFGLPNYYAEDRLVLKPEDLDEVIFYKDNEDRIFFIPVSMVNKTVYLDDGEIQVCEHQDEGRMNLYLYSYDELELKLERAIYPVPDRRVFIFSEEVQDVLDEFRLLGTAHVPFPEDIPDGAAKLYENEYTDAVVDIIHSFFYEGADYGEYQIYFGDYQYIDVWAEKGYKIVITVAIVGEGTSYWWEFRAKDVLAEDGRVILDSCVWEQHSFPAEYDKENGDYYAPWIDGIIHANRLVVPLTITENDEVKPIGGFIDEDDLNTLHLYLE